MSEKTDCHTYDSLVREMASRLVINDEKILPKEGDEFDYEDINSWIGAVDFAEGKTPNIEVRLSSSKGKDVVKFETQEQETVKSADEKVGNKKLLYSMALTEAKMKVISDIAEDTYPAVAFQIKDYRKEMEKMREEILGNKKENTSLDEVINRVMSKKTLAAALIIGGMVLSACGSGIEVTSKATATETQPRVTETVDVEVSKTAPEVTETPFVEVTPTVEMTPTTEVVTPDPLVAIEEFNLDSERTYTLSEDGYLVDSFNQAKMALWSDKNNEWVDTSLEEKYGHLVPEDEFLITRDRFGNPFFDDRGVIDASDRRYWNVEILVRSVGNVYQKNEYDEALEMETTNIYGSVVYRDIEGKIQLLNVRFDVVAPDTKIKKLPVCTYNVNKLFKCGALNFLNISTVENEISYYNSPGDLLNLTFAYERPEDDPTVLHPEDLYPNYRNVSNRGLWDKQKDIYRKLAKGILENGKIVAPDDFIVAAQFVSPYMTHEELVSLWTDD